MDEEHGDVLVEAVHEHLRDPGIVPSTMDEEKPLKKAELGDGKVGAIGGLQSFVARYAHTDSCRLEDTNLISCVSLVLANSGLMVLMFQGLGRKLQLIHWTW